MMANNLTGQLLGSEIHGFHTLQELDVGIIMEEARCRWLRPNEIHAILCNHKNFTIHVKPVTLPKSGTLILFDRKKLRNFRKDGHNWKKKKDGKTVKEAHEHLKVGNEERIHVYYAHGEENPNFVRRCYWLLDKNLEHIVLVHYRETQELQGSPVTPVYSNASSPSDPTTPWVLSEELDSGINKAYAGDLNDNLTVKSHELRLHEINTLEWDDLVVTNDLNASTTSTRPGGKAPCFHQEKQILLNGNSSTVVDKQSADIPSFDIPNNSINGINSAQYNFHESSNLQTFNSQSNSNVQSEHSITISGGDLVDSLVNDTLQSQDSFGKWISNMISDSPCSIDDSGLESSVSSVHDSYSSVLDNHQPSLPEQVFNITDVSPGRACSTENTKVLITGIFHDDYLHLAKSNMFCICGDVPVPTEFVQLGVYRCWVPPHSPGFVNLYMSSDGHKPISQVVNFEYRTTVVQDPAASTEERYNREEFRLQMRLAYLLFSTQKSLDITSSKVLPDALKEAKKFVSKTSYISKSWQYLIESTEDHETPFPQTKDALFEIALKTKLKEWLLERIILGCQTTELDARGQGVIHLCSILGYRWAVSLFSLSGFSLNFRDKFGWTALHWAAYYGRERMVASLLSAGARPNLVTDPTPQHPGGFTAACLAQMKGYDGLAAYLSEKSLVEHLKEMSIAGNASGSLETTRTSDPVKSEKFNEDHLYMRDTLAAYRTAAEAAARIQAAFREQSLKLRSHAVEIFSPEAEARQIVAAMKIQHAFRNFETRKSMAAAARIQHTFRTWKMRREFLNMRRQAIRIQAAFRAFKERKNYRKIIWSVGVVEKAILRWRLKRRGFRGLHVNPVQEVEGQQEETEFVTEEDFFRTGRKQAEERVERAVVRVQAMFRSKKAQVDYRRMKLAHNQATMELEHEELLNSEVDMGVKT
ncbi:calmodulin-binding transcription activator 5-like isoform X2 [Prosopis cineraria]|uniref:calmodulin-binding transcription activator 5-like isoform X2 n=1 Tax=Prosopis cineraria TaxID=364024 RepID=UPI00240EC2E7|nr:calmodulin-binding transcription activator 5-like isoform X2 [Prosopis cineraria]